MNFNQLWGMSHQFNVFVLWGKKEPKSLEDFIGEFATYEQAKQKADELKEQNAYVQLRISHH